MGALVPHVLRTDAKMCFIRLVSELLGHKYTGFRALQLETRRSRSRNVMWIFYVAPQKQSQCQLI